jgi:N-acetylglutamate synthase-like GNAT family acetyltransferase
MSNIRLAKLDDCGSINQLSRLFGYPQTGDEVARDRLNVLLDSDADQVWVFEKEKQILGWIHVFIAHRLASAEFAEIGGLVVNTEHRRTGIGRCLVVAAQEWAAQLELRLRVRCNSKREETHHFYKALGFSEMKLQIVFEPVAHKKT